MKHLIKLLLLVSFFTASAKDNLLNNPVYVNKQQILWVNNTLSKMTVEEKIGQLLIVGAFSSGKYENAAYVEKLIKKYHVGGVLFFKGEPVKQVKLTNKFQSISKIPLLISMDTESGVSMRLSKSQKLPLQMIVAATGNLGNAYHISSIIAKECKRIGVHMSYSPVLDVNVNAHNKVIGMRSFGGNQEEVTKYSISSLEGYLNNGVLACAKHFPGHGGSNKDSHITLPKITTSAKNIEAVDLYPYRKLIEKKLPAIMVGHLEVPALEKKKIPSSLSYKIIQKLLRNKMKFNGLVISDALNMGGVKKSGSNVDVNIKAFKAGNDMLTYPLDIPKTVAKFKSELKKGKISYARLDESVRRILMVKYWAGLGDYHKISTQNLIRDLNPGKTIAYINKITRESITLIKNKNNTLPIIDVEKPIANITFGADNFHELQNRLNDYTVVKNFVVGKSNFEDIRKKTKSYKKIIISVDNPFRKKRGSRKEYKKLISNMQKQITILSKNKDVILNYMGNPYLLYEFGKDTNFDAILISYQRNEISQQFVAATIFGANSPTGILPVNISDKYKIKTSLTYNDISRLSYSVPELEGMDSNTLRYIDSLMKDVIKDKVTPGAQILIAKNGKIVYNKSFGYKTYKKENKIKNSYLYDVSSITKILASVPMMMKMKERGDIDLDTPIEKYLPELKKTNKAKMTLRKMMADNTNLMRWNTYYKKTLNKNGTPSKKYYKFNYDNEHTIKVSDNLYLQKDVINDIYKDVINSPLKPNTKHKSGSLPYYFLKKIVEKKEKYNTFSKIIERTLYEPMGINRIIYKPKNKFSKKEIVPSEITKDFRNRTLYGEVNDLETAMQGGVSGHSGIFANSYSVAVMMQMYLQGGYYGGKRYFKESTVREFTKCQYCYNGNRRGIGFDKPQLSGAGPAYSGVSFLSFGQTGYTGTMAWADPDKKLVYIFLSNRTYPESKNNKLVKQNVRTEIQKIIYKSIKNAK